MGIIAYQQKEKEGPDLVTFDLLMTWESNVDKSVIGNDET